MIEIGAVVFAVVVVLTIGTSIGLVALALLLVGAHSVVVAVIRTLQLDVAVVLEKRLKALTLRAALSLMEALVRAAHVGVQHVNESFLSLYLFILITPSHHYYVRAVHYTHMSYIYI